MRSFLLTIGCIILGIIIISALFIGIVILAMYYVASGIAYKNETEASAWDYWETHNRKHWAELSVEEKEKIVVANLIIADDIVVVVSKKQLVKILEEQLPVTEPHVGLSYPMGC